MSYKIVIPSRERASWLRSRKYTTMHFMGAESDARLWIRDDDTQKNEYYKYAEDMKTTMLLYDAIGVHGAAQTYDLIIEDAIKAHCDVLIILDDDLSFSMRNPILDAKPDYKLVTSQEFNALLVHATHLVSEELPLLSFTPIMSRSQERIISFCKPMMMAYVFYVEHFKKYPEHRFWQGEQIEARCDLNLSLKLLTEGFLTAYICTLFIPDNVNNPGGCSTYRDIKCERASVDYLKMTYPTFVRTRPKRGWLGDPDVIREAPVISWKRAFNHDLFKERFIWTAVTYANELVAYYERAYANFIKEIRRETERPDTVDKR